MRKKITQFGTTPGMTAAANYAQVGGAVAGGAALGRAANKGRSEKQRVQKKSGSVGCSSCSGKMH